MSISLSETFRACLLARQGNGGEAFIGSGMQLFTFELLAGDIGLDGITIGPDCDMEYVDE